MNIWPEVFRETDFPNCTIRELFHQLDLEPFKEDLEVEYFLDRFVVREGDHEKDGKRWL